MELDLAVSSIHYRRKAASRLTLAKLNDEMFDPAIDDLRSASQFARKAKFSEERKRAAGNRMGDKR